MSEVSLDMDKLEALSGKVVTDITGAIGFCCRILVINPVYIRRSKLMDLALRHNWQLPLA